MRKEGKRILELSQDATIDGRNRARCKITSRYSDGPMGSCFILSYLGLFTWIMEATLCFRSEQRLDLVRGPGDQTVRDDSSS